MQLSTESRVFTPGAEWENINTAGSRIKIDNSSSMPIESVCKVSHARIFAMNIAATLIHTAQTVTAMENETNKHTYKFNAMRALSNA